MEKYSKGEEWRKDSVNDDLESFFEDLRLGKKTQNDKTTYFLPKLTEEELILAESKDPNYARGFIDPHYTPYHEAEMKTSESDSRYVRGICRRVTETLENPFYT